MYKNESDEFGFLIKEAIEILERLSTGFKVTKINYNYFKESSKEESMLKEERVETTDTKQAKDLLVRLKKFLEVNDNV